MAGADVAGAAGGGGAAGLRLKKLNMGCRGCGGEAVSSTAVARRAPEPRRYNSRLRRFSSVG